MYSKLDNWMVCEDVYYIKFLSLHKLVLKKENCIINIQTEPLYDCEFHFGLFVDSIKEWECGDSTMVMPKDEVKNIADIIVRTLDFFKIKIQINNQRLAQPPFKAIEKRISIEELRKVGIDNLDELKKSK